MVVTGVLQQRGAVGGAFMPLCTELLASFFSVFEQPQMLQYPLPPTPRGLPNVEDQGGGLLLPALEALYLVADPLFGAPDPLALGPVADWAEGSGAPSSQPVPWILFHEGGGDGPARVLHVPDPRHPHDLGEPIILILQFASQFPSHCEGDENHPLYLSFILILLRPF